MEALLPMFFALGIGFTHAFEADHLIAISNIVTERRKPQLALKDGVYWGLGHTTTILIIGAIIILGKLMISEMLFGYLEGLVGVLLIGLGLVRLSRLRRQASQGVHDHAGHRLAFGVGLIHGIAGSGAVVLLAITELSGIFTEFFYLVSFGLGSIVGMLIAAGLFSLPFAKKFTDLGAMRTGMVLLSSFLCIGYGAYILLNLA